MRTFEFTVPYSGEKYTLKVPDEVVFSDEINKIYVERDSTTSSGRIKVYVEDDESAYINLSFNVVKAEANISSLLKRTFIDENITTLYKNINLVFKLSTGTYSIGFCVIKGFKILGERIRQYGIYDETKDNKHQERHITRFVHFPFTLSFLAFNGEYAEYKSDGYTEYSPYFIDGEIKYTGLYKQEYRPLKVQSGFPHFDLFKITNGSGTSKFTEEYNYAFWQLGKEETLIFLHHDDRKDGTFLRWIDNKGYWQQYLFYNGKIRTKYERGTEVCREEQIISDMIVEMHNPSSIKSTRSMTVCATSLNEEAFETVSSIANSLHVEMYLGKKNEIDQWIPVKVTTDQIERSSKKILNDIEIELQIEEKTITI